MPVITNMTPTPDVSAGTPAPGGFPPSYVAAKTTAIQFDLTDPQGLRLVELSCKLTMPAGQPAIAGVRTIYRAGAFQEEFVGSTATAITDGLRFVVRRDGGWPAGVQIALYVDAVDNNGEALSDSPAPEVTLSSITVTPAAPTMTSRTTPQQMTATGNYSDASTADLTALVTWASASPAVATVSNAGVTKGQVTAVATGTSTVSAVLGAVSGNTTVTVALPQCDPPFAGTGAYAAIKRPAAPDQFPCIVTSGPAITQPDYFWNMQESSGALVDAVMGGSLPATGAVTYGNTISNWTTNWVGTTEVSNQGFYAAAGSLWNISAQSLFLVEILCVTGATAERIVTTLAATGSSSVWVSITAAGFLKLNRAGSNQTGSTNYENATPTPLIIATQYDRRGAGVCRLDSKKIGTALETLTATWATHVDGQKFINSSVGAAPPAALRNWAAAWVGSKAEAMMDRGGANLGGVTLIANMGF